MTLISKFYSKVFSTIRPLEFPFPTLWWQLEDLIHLHPTSGWPPVQESTIHTIQNDNFGTEQSHKIFIGQDRRNRVLAGLYMGRPDVALMMRQSSIHVWKVIVTNTTREILPTLFNLLLGCLGSSSYDKSHLPTSYSLVYKNRSN